MEIYILDNQQLLRMLFNEQQKEQGFRLLMQKYGNKIYWHIRRIVVGREDAEDVVQETLIKIFSNIPDFHGDAAQLPAWMYRIATREALQMLRRKTSFFQSIDSLSNTLIDTLKAECDIGDSSERLLQEAILTLPTTQRLVFNMRYYDDMDYEQIATVTGKKVGTLKTNYHYASEHIKQYIKEKTQ